MRGRASVLVAALAVGIAGVVAPVDAAVDRPVPFDTAPVLAWTKSTPSDSVLDMAHLEAVRGRPSLAVVGPTSGLTTSSLLAFYTPHGTRSDFRWKLQWQRRLDSCPVARVAALDDLVVVACQRVGGGLTVRRFGAKGNLRWKDTINVGDASLALRAVSIKYGSTVNSGRRVLVLVTTEKAHGGISSTVLVWGPKGGRMRDLPLMLPGLPLASVEMTTLDTQRRDIAVAGRVQRPDGDWDLLVQRYGWPAQVPTASAAFGDGADVDEDQVLEVQLGYGWILLNAVVADAGTDGPRLMVLRRDHPRQVVWDRAASPSVTGQHAVLVNERRQVLLLEQRQSRSVLLRLDEDGVASWAQPFNTVRTHRVANGLDMQASWAFVIGETRPDGATPTGRIWAYRWLKP